MPTKVCLLEASTTSRYTSCNNLDVVYCACNELPCFSCADEIIFRLSPGHNSFFATMLVAPLADIIALVIGFLFVLGAADGHYFCLFTVASLTNTFVGMYFRLVAMDAWLSAGFLHLLIEYSIVIALKISACGLANLIIAYEEMEIGLVDVPGGAADHEWVLDQVLSRRSSEERVAEDRASAYDAHGRERPEHTFFEPSQSFVTSTRSTRSRASS